mgnify:FL=1
MKTRKRMGAVLAMAAVVLGVLGAMGGYFFCRNYRVLAGKPYLKTAEVLNLSGVQGVEFDRLRDFPQLKMLDARGTGMDVASYRMLREANPDCKITWDIPFQGRFLPEDTQEVTVATLTAEEAQALALVPGLLQVDGLECRDYDALELLAGLRPDCQVNYRVDLGGLRWGPGVRSIELQEADAQELATNLPHLPQVETILLKTALPDPALVSRLQREFPKIGLFYALADRDVPLDAKTTMLSLNQCPLTLELAQKLIQCYPELQEAELLECGLEEEELRQLCDDNPQVFFLWEGSFGPVRLRTDAVDADLSGMAVTDLEELEQALPYYPKLQKVDLSDCGLENEELDALNKRHQDVRFVWTVSVGKVRVRTDSLFFAPVKTGQTVYEGQLDNLRYCPDVIAVDVGHMPLKTCDWVRYFPKLQYLIIADTGISDITPLADCENLIFLEMFLTLCRDYSPLQQCKNLEDLNLCYTYGPADPVREMTWLKRLWWDGIRYNDKDIADSLPNTEVNLDSGSSTGGGWREGAHYREQRDILGMAYLHG